MKKRYHIVGEISLSCGGANYWETIDVDTTLEAADRFQAGRAVVLDVMWKYGAEVGNFIWVEIVESEIPEWERMQRMGAPMLPGMAVPA